MRRARTIAASVVTLGAFFAVSYYVTAWFFARSGYPAGPWQSVVAGYMAVIGNGALHVGLRHRQKDEPVKDSIFCTLEEIAQGNFNVFVEKKESGQVIEADELADRINRMAEELRSLEQLRQDFTSNVSHEFRSPLTSINGYAALLAREAATPEQAEYARIIEQESKRLSKLADDLLLLSILEDESMDMERQSFRLDRQIEDVILLLEPQWTAKKMELEVSLARVTLSGSADLLQQVWINLLVNAVKFTPEKGKISVTLRRREDTAECRIRDSGIGIPAADQMHIFERFYKVDKARSRALGGNGLGLSLVRKIVELHGGSVSVKSAPGEGSTFVVALPLRTPGEAGRHGRQ